MRQKPSPSLWFPERKLTNENLARKNHPVFDFL
ncbi:hypothetical protein THMA_1046 [Thermotoga maritima MSB8]|uniref:Uncharacterized protein n=1 Tax=Thermotoga maritima (strain ATCC 43589 / DSM 3109 / JCM 10099 / NBRC 100826 / MSB8) TaxID=243274 RepID=Q9X0B5_THEMA|nr:hypothetical protein TM_1025 [Thermotoga maritima MSB8]AGL49951.1 hypothetical protein Tmari_1027 [Thermotoga maritima MSB8]AKE27787.1 hypothetical protein THMC_1046 [Thermotoga maritima]AKE29660.1 hypothetical protein THMA_1046 [Thermotoga maritima MSB8]AKE31530.1 hypothetical protein THMB_1046 [Thermotoga maritima]